MDITPQMIDAARRVRATLLELEAVVDPNSMTMPSAVARHHNALGSLLEHFKDGVSAEVYSELNGGMDKTL
jgi:hypothetical protein